MYERGLGTLNEELTQVRVPTLADRPQCRFPTGRMLARHQSQPRGHVATPREHAPVTDCGDDGRGDHRTNAGDSGHATTERRLTGPLGQVARDLGNLAVERELALTESVE